MDQKRKLEYDIVYMNVAKNISTLSYAIRNKVGCIIVSEDGQILSQGFNGTPTGFNNECEIPECIYGENHCAITGKLKRDQLSLKFCNNILSNDSKNKYRCNFLDMKTKPEVLHAESNAISKCAKHRSSTLNSTMYVTLSPCIDCAKLIIQAGIKRLVFSELYRNQDGLELLKKSNILIEQLIYEDDKYKLLKY